MFWVILGSVGFIVGSVLLVFDIGEYFVTWKSFVGFIVLIVGFTIACYGFGVFNSFDFSNFFKPMSV